MVSKVEEAGIVIDHERLMARLDGRDVGLTHKEFLILWLLEDAGGRVLSRKALETGIGMKGRSYRLIDQHISRIRAKIGAKCISTLPCIGYRYNERFRR